MFDYIPPYVHATTPPTLNEMAEPATISRPGDPVLRLSGDGSVAAVVLKPHSKGGGYLGDVRIQRRGAPLSPNLATYRFGRGWQSSIRDNTGHWNPTQAGFREVVGISARLVEDAGGIAIGPFQVPLFQHSGDDGFDFTRKENLAADDFPNDRGRDTDLLGGERNQLGEVISEVSYRGRIDPLQLGIPAFRHRFYYALDKDPGSIKQFRTAAKDIGGAPVFDPALVRPGFSRLEPSNIILSYGVRMQDIPGWTFTHYGVDEGSLRATPKSPDGNENRDRTEVPIDGTQRPLAVISTGDEGAVSIGLYATAMNAEPVPGDAARRRASKFVFVRDSSASSMIFRSQIEGLHKGEQIYCDVVILFGTKSEILAAVRRLETP